MNVQADEFRDESSAIWETGSGRWSSAVRLIEGALQPANEFLQSAVVGQLRTSDGDQGQISELLEIGCGDGSLGFVTLQKLIDELGSETSVNLTLTDASLAMQKLVDQKIAQQKPAGLSFKSMPIEWIDCKAATLDVAYARLAFEYCIDKETAFREVRRTLKPSGQLVFACWADQTVNPLLGSVVSAHSDHGVSVCCAGIETPIEFSLSSSEEVSDLLYSAGFLEVSVAECGVMIPALEVSELCDLAYDLLPYCQSALKQLPAEIAGEVLQQVEVNLGGAFAGSLDGKSNLEAGHLLLVSAIA